MADYGIKVSKPGYDASTTVVSQQAFNSQKNCLKLSVSGSGSFTQSVAAGTNTFYVSHSLGYTPTFLCFFEVNSNGKWYPMSTIEDQSGANIRVEVYSTSTQLRFDIGADASASVKVVYTLMVDPGPT